jgi:hypothetical protein
MLVAGMALMWIGYGIGMTGWSLANGYPLKLAEIWSPVGYYTGEWPPNGKIPPEQVFP